VLRNRRASSCYISRKRFGKHFKMCSLILSDFFAKRLGLRTSPLREGVDLISHFILHKRWTKHWALEPNVGCKHGDQIGRIFAY
jgi:hypothetical protein